MSRATYVIRDGKAVLKHLAPPRNPPPARSHAVALPALNRDHIEPTLHPCTGQIIDSKSKFREITRAHGCVEVGNEPLPAYTPPKVESVQETMARTWEQLEQRSEDDKWASETGPEHPDLTGQSLTILTPHGQSLSGRDLAEAKTTGAEIRELPPEPAPLPPA